MIVLLGLHVDVVEDLVQRLDVVVVMLLRGLVLGLVGSWWKDCEVVCT